MRARAHADTVGAETIDSAAGAADTLLNVLLGIRK